MNNIIESPAHDGEDLDAAIEHARGALTALLRCPGGSGYPKMVAEARALHGTLLERRFALAAARLDERDAAERDAAERDAAEPDVAARNAAAVAAARADRDEAIAVTGALLYWLELDHPVWPEVAQAFGRLSYDRYSDAWPDPAPPDPADLDAACDLLQRAARYEEADERTARYLVLALRDRQLLLACPADASALMAWCERLLSFPDAGGLGRDDLHDRLELEVLGLALAPSPARSH